MLRAQRSCTSFSFLSEQVVRKGNQAEDAGSHSDERGKGSFLSGEHHSHALPGYSLWLLTCMFMSHETWGLLAKSLQQQVKLASGISRPHSHCSRSRCPLRCLLMLW